MGIYFAQAATHPDVDLEAFQSSFHPDKVQFQVMILLAQTERSKKAVKKHVAKATPPKINIFVSGKDFVLRAASRRIAPRPPRSPLERHAF